MRAPRFSPRRLLGGAALVCAVLVVPLPAPADAARSVDLHVTGRGFGHGHGMSQYGAEGAAKKGFSAAKILAFYYPGLKRGTAGGTVSVLMSADTTDDVVVAARSGLRLTALGDGRTRTADLHVAGARQWRIVAADGGRKSAVSYRTSKGGWHAWHTVAGQAQFDAHGDPVTLVLPHGATAAYRGVLRSAAPSARSTARNTVNIVPLESYLRGVVPREAFPSWHPAALQAQAVAARTYAAFERAQPLSSSYQICDTSACQVYGGYSSEVGTTDAAVRATRGQVLLAGTKPAFTQFSASNGGWTAAGSESYLVAEQDPYDTAYRNWRVTLGAAAVERAFPGLGTLTGAKVTDGDGHGQWKGRVSTVHLTGSRGSVNVSGDLFRSVFGLRSSWFTIG